MLKLDIMDDFPDPQIDIADFENRVAGVLGQLKSGNVRRFELVKDGRVVAILSAPAASLYGYLRGSAVIPEGLDLTAPAFDGLMNADDGRIHE